MRAYKTRARAMTYHLFLSGARLFEADGTLSIVGALPPQSLRKLGMKELPPTFFPENVSVVIIIS